MNASVADPRLRADLERSIGRRVEPAEVEDIVQSVLVEALGSRRLPETQEEIRRFVFAIARQRVIDWYRLRDRERPDDTMPDEAALETTAANDLLHWAHETLPAAPSSEAPRTFDWMLREGEGETLAEIAAAERVPAAVVRQRVSRLRRFFRQRWMRELATVAAAVIASVLVGYLMRREPPPPTAKEAPSPAPSAESAASAAPSPSPSPSASSSAPPPKVIPAPKVPRAPARPSTVMDPWGPRTVTPPLPPTSTYTPPRRSGIEDPW